MTDSYGEAGRDPANLPGAVVSYPDVDPMLRYDPATRRVTDARNGTYLLGQIVDNRERTARFYIYDENDEILFYAKAYIANIEKPGGGSVRSFDVRYVTDQNEKDLMMEDAFPIEWLSRFLNLYVPFAGPDTGNMAIIDNRVVCRDYPR